MNFDHLAGKRVMLIGGAGFIGHNLALRLNELGAKVAIIDSLHVNNLLSFSANPSVDRQLYLRIINERIDLIHDAGISLDIQDARDYHMLSKVIGRFAPDVVVQLAAVSHAARSNKDPYSTFDHSLRTLENALDAARGLNAHFVFFSSSMVYGNFDAESVTEDHPLNPIGIYAALKLSGEKITHAYHQVFDLPYTVVRPSALYGERCVSRRVGQVFIENAIKGNLLTIDGDGKERLDFTYIDDLVQGLCLVIGNEAAYNQTFNLTYGSSRAIVDLVDILRSHFDDLMVKFKPRDKLMPFRGTLCVDRAKEVLGYDPSHPLDVGYPKYIDWYKTIAGKK